MAGWRRTKLFRIDQIRDLSAVALPPAAPNRMIGVPFFGSDKTGPVRLSYGPRSVHVAAGLDGSEAPLVVSHLRERLPASVSSR